jgi:cobalt-zinc-cadmium efflux system membrane fusion protein
MKSIRLILLVSLFLLACSNKQVQTQDVAEPMKDLVQLNLAQLKSAGISLDTARFRVMSSLVKVSGKVEAPPQNYISISAPLGGFLKSTELLPGMKVHKGEVLAILEDQQYVQLQQDYLSAKASLILNEKEFVRQKDLNNDKASSDKALEQAQAALSYSRAQLAGLREKLKLAGISVEQLTESNLSRQIPLVSPITGYVAKVNVNVGKYVAPQDVLFELVNPDDIHLALTIFEKDIDKLEVGQKVTAYSNNSDKRYACEVILLGRNLSAERSIDVHCHFIDYDHSLLPGMYMNAEIETASKRVLCLPNEAFVDYESRRFVFVEQSIGVFKMIEVQSGSSDGKYQQLVSVTDIRNKKIVVKGVYSLLMKLKNSSEQD